MTTRVKRLRKNLPSSPTGKRKKPEIMTKSGTQTRRSELVHPTAHDPYVCSTVPSDALYSNSPVWICITMKMDNTRRRSKPRCRVGEGEAATVTLYGSWSCER